MVSDIIRIEIFDINGVEIPIQDLDTPIVFYLNLTRGPRRSECRSTGQLEREEAECSWWNGSSWTTSGCTTRLIREDLAECSCSHLTDFAMILRSQSSREACVVSPAFYVLLAGFLTVGGYGVVILAWLALDLKKMRPAKEQRLFFKKFNNLSKVFGLTAAIAALRVMACLRYSGISDVDPTFIGVCTALVFLFTFWLFTRLVFQWASMHHFPMNPHRDRLIRPFFLASNVLLAVFVVLTFAGSFFFVASCREA